VAVCELPPVRVLTNRSNPPLMSCVPTLFVERKCARLAEICQLLRSSGIVGVPVRRVVVPARRDPGRTPRVKYGESITFGARAARVAEAEVPARHLRRGEQRRRDDAAPARDEQVVRQRAIDVGRSDRRSGPREAGLHLVGRVVQVRARDRVVLERLPVSLISPRLFSTVVTIGRPVSGNVPCSSESWKRPAAEEPELVAQDRPAERALVELRQRSGALDAAIALERRLPRPGLVGRFRR
jgi:hypothetical protein